jgi:hypothetical protein
MRKLMSTHEGRVRTLTIQFQAILTLLLCQTDVSILYNFFQDKTDLLKECINLIRSGPGTATYNPRLIPLHSGRGVRIKAIHLGADNSTCRWQVGVVRKQLAVNNAWPDGSPDPADYSTVTFTPELYAFAEYLSLSPLVAALADKALCETGEELALQDRRPEPAAVASLAIKATCGGRTVRLHVDPDIPFEELCAAIRDSLGLDDKDVDLFFYDDENELCWFSKGTFSDALNIAARLRPHILHIVLKPIRER